MTDIGELVVRIKADAAQLEREMAKANGVVKQSAGGMATAFGRLKSEILSLAPALSAVALVQFGRHALDAAGHIVDLSDRIGFAASTLAALEIPLAQSGSNLDEFAAAANRMNNMVGEAAKGSEEAVKAFDGLGLSVAKLRTLSPEDQFYAIAGALGRIKDQSTQTEAGMNIFGRGFAAMLPLLKQYEGDMRKAAEAQKRTNEGLSPEALARLDDFGDKLSSQAIRVRNLFLEAAAAILDTGAALSRATAKPATNAKSGMPGQNPLPQSYIDKAKALGMVTSATFVGKEAYGPPYQPPDAKGDNKALLGRKEADEAGKARAKQIADAKAALDDYSRSLRQEGALLKLSDRDRVAQEARFKAEEIARRGNIVLTEKQVDALATQAAANYDLTQSQEAANTAMQEAARVQQVLHDKLSSTLTDIAFRAGSASDAMIGFAESIARAAFEKKVAGPLADALIGSGGGAGILDGVLGGVGSFFGGFFADGGSPPVGKASIVGERGPEIFVPNTAGTIIPNHALGGGQQIQVVNHWHVSPGVEETVEIGLRRAAPAIVSQSVAAVLHAAQQGGAASRVFGKRS